MSEKTDLYSRISECNREIGIIRQDIAGMQQSINQMRLHADAFETQKEDVSTYDMTVGDTWRKQLCDGAVEIQKSLVLGIGKASSQCENVITELNGCIATANRRITSLQNDIASCQSRIAAIEAEERAAAEREAAARAAAAAARQTPRRAR